MILVWGSPQDPPVEQVLAALSDRGAAVMHLEDADLATVRYDVVLGATPAGWIEHDGRRVAVDGFTGAYLRPDNPVLPRTRRVAEAAGVVLAVLAGSSGRVVNRPDSGRANWSKPFQLGLIAAAGLHVPPTLVTTDPTEARAFLGEHGRLVYKSVSGIRSVVAVLEAADAGDHKRLDGVRTGPVQLQRWIAGLDVRVHVVGDRWLATAVRSDAADYRYAPLVGRDVEMSHYELPAELGAQLVALSRGMGLLVSGIDLRLTPQGEWVCFEVNPSPGFTYYEECTGQPIAAAIADLLAGNGSTR